MIDAETGAVKLARIWCRKGDSRADIERRMDKSVWTRKKQTDNKFIKRDFFSIDEEFGLMVKLPDLFAFLYFRMSGLVCVKFGFESIYRQGVREQVEAYKTYLLETCGLKPGEYVWGHIHVNGDLRDGSSEIDVIYD